MSTVKNQFLTEQVQPCELTSLKNPPLPVLAADNHRRFKTGPFTVSPLTQGVLKNELLPRVENQTRSRGELDCLRPRRAGPWNQAQMSRLLRAEQHGLQ